MVGIYDIEQFIAREQGRLGGNGSMPDTCNQSLQISSQVVPNNSFDIEAAAGPIHESISPNTTINFIRPSSSGEQVDNIEMTDQSID